MLLKWQKLGRRHVARVGGSSIVVKSHGSFCRYDERSKVWLVDEVFGSRFDDMNGYLSLEEAQEAALRVAIKIAGKIRRWADKLERE